MFYISLPDDADRRLSFYLAMEEWLAIHVLPCHKREWGEECFFMWQVDPSVIFGRNQLIYTEVNIPYCRQHGIGMYRRKSGGGCVYADRGNVMFSYITLEDNVSITFTRYLSMIVQMLRKLGVEATATGRNDIMIGEKKVSGNAFYHLTGCSIVHGTMLYDTDMHNMQAAITPSEAKLRSKGVESVRQHVALLKDCIKLTLPEFKAFARASLTNGEFILDSDDVARIEDLEKEYLRTEFIFGHNPHFSRTWSRRVEGVGTLVAEAEIRNDVIKTIDIKGDFFLIGDIDILLRPFVGKPLTRSAIEETVKALPDTATIISGLTKETFIDFLTKT